MNPLPHDMDWSGCRAELESSPVHTLSHVAGPRVEGLLEAGFHPLWHLHCLSLLRPYVVKPASR